MFVPESVNAPFPVLVSEPLPSMTPDRAKSPTVLTVLDPESVTLPESEAALTEELAKVPLRASASPATV